MLWEDAAVEYIELLQSALARDAVFLYFHGRVTPDTPDDQVQRGRELREILGIKGTGE